MEDQILRWSAYEHDPKERSSDWYWALGIVAVCLAIASIILENYLFALLIVVAAGVLVLYARQPMEEVEFVLTDRGIRIHGTLHRFDQMIAFWVEDEHTGAEHAQLLIATKKVRHHMMVIPIEGIEPSAIRAFMKNHIRERHLQEPAAHKILEWFGL
jgi:hypothetical protein